MKLKRLKINRYRSVRPCELVFNDGLNIVLGTNGSGKTTLLEFISSVLQSSLTNAADPFSFEFELAFPEGSLSGAVATPERSEVERLLAGPLAAGGIAAAAGGPEVWPQFKLALRLDSIPATLTVERRGDRIEVSRDGAAVNSISLASVGSEFGFLDLTLAVPLVLERLPVPEGINGLEGALRYDESLDAFRAIVSQGGDEGLVSPRFRPDITGVTLAKISDTSWLPTGFVPRSLLDRVRLAFSPTTTNLALAEGDLPFLAEYVRLLGLRSAEARLEITSKDVKPDGNTILHLGNLRFWFTRRDGSGLRDRDLSYGQKRLLAFLYYLDANPSFVIADELVNGLHHAWIEECMKAIGDRQAFLTSQNPLLLDYLTFASPEEARTSFIVCRTEAVGDREEMVWRNLTDDEAEMFFNAYRVGVEHVGEILRTRGLW